MNSNFRFPSRVLCTFLSIGILAQSAMALPKKSQRSRITDFQAYAVAQDPILKGTEILADDREKVVYISPTSKKSQSGAFQAVATPACDILKDNYDLTYLMPNVPVDQYVNFAKNGPFSPFFDARIGNYVRHASMLHSIATKIQEIGQLKVKNKDTVAAFEEAKFLLEQAQGEYQVAEAAYAELSKNISSLMELLKFTTDADERARIEAELVEARKLKVSEELTRAERVRLAILALMPIKPKYTLAKAKYDIVLPTISELTLQQATLETIFQSMQTLSEKHWSANETALQAFESATVGTASASYSIWGDEESRLRNVLALYNRRVSYFSKYGVVRLPIHNIRLKKPVGNVIQSNISGSFNGETTMAVTKVGTTNGGLSVGDQASSSVYPTFTKDNQAVVPEVKKLSNDGAGTYTNLVTRGAFCTGSSKRHKWPVNVTFTDNNLQIRSNFDVFTFKGRTTNVLAQSVALEYEYYVRTDPIGVTCTMDISKFRSFAVDTGSSGFLFWRDSWAEQQRSLVDNSGIVCNVTMSPTGDSPNYQDQANRVEAIRQAMMQELAAEFILTYAKSWQVSQTQPALPKKKDAAVAAGIALETLCGTNVYCAVTSIVLKTGDELFGSHADKVRNRDYLSGKIRRGYDESSWTISNGTAVIDLVVNL